MVTDSDANPQHFTLQTKSLAEREDVAAAAHELCNHLQVLSSAIGLLKRAIPGESKGDFDLIFSGADLSLNRASCLSRRLVNAEGSGKAVSCGISIASRLAEVRNVVVLAAGPAILVEYVVADDVPDVICDANAFDDAILNIVVNATHAMPAGGHILITAMSEIGARGIYPSAVVRIADTGCGMSAAVAQRAFEPRFTTKGPGQGSGLGLATVAAFARSAGGAVDLESQQGAGTIITIRLPGLMKSAKLAAAPRPPCN